MSLAVRPATPADVADVAALEEEVFGADAWSPASVEEELTSPRRRAVVAESTAGAVVGYAVILLGGDVVDLQRIAVTPTSRRAGVARTLLAEAVALARAEGGSRMLLEVSATNTGARAFYADAGFIQIDLRPRYYRDGADALVLRADLGTAACGRKGA